MTKKVLLGLLILILILIFIYTLFGCSNAVNKSEDSKSSQTKTVSEIKDPQSETQHIKEVNYRAVYLTPQNGGVLPQSELNLHPEVLVVSSFEDLKNSVDKKISVWIDKDAVSLLEQGWLQKEPQKNYPIVLVGYNDTLYSFREKLNDFGIQGPKIDWTKKKVEPGFSAWKLIEQNPSGASAFSRGYDISPTVDKIIYVTDILLKGEYPEIPLIREWKAKDNVPVPESISPLAVVNNLSAIDVDNLNDASNSKVILNLKKGWNASKSIWNKAEEFDYNDLKNKYITEVNMFDIYNGNDETIGEFSEIGRYKGLEENVFPNHLQSKIKIYDGDTKLGKGEIYLLRQDLPKDKMTKEINYCYICYAVMPINNEELAYNLSLKVSDNNKLYDSLKIMEDMLGVSDIKSNNSE